ncbi:hypothetical protein V8G54_015840 [Vigna mungo]|uniref:Uncharacterized protein n=1 Tax=Vigna mungo TaxID=3915 RepID=A0AAQ3NJ74_VIGMU
MNPTKLLKSDTLFLFSSEPLNPISPSKNFTSLLHSFHPLTPIYSMTHLRSPSSGGTWFSNRVKLDTTLITTRLSSSSNSNLPFLACTFSSKACSLVSSEISTEPKGKTSKAVAMDLDMTRN